MYKTYSHEFVVPTEIDSSDQKDMCPQMSSKRNEVFLKKATATNSMVTSYIILAQKETLVMLYIMIPVDDYSGHRSSHKTFLAGTC